MVLKAPSFFILESAIYNLGLNIILIFNGNILVKFCKYWNLLLTFIGKYVNVIMN